MKTLLVLTTAFLFNTAFAGTCTNISGTYEMRQCGADGFNWPFQVGNQKADNLLTIKQTGCDSMELSFKTIPWPEITPPRYVSSRMLNLKEAQLTSSPTSLNVKLTKAYGNLGGDGLPLPRASFDSANFNFSLQKDILTIKSIFISKDILIIFPSSRKHEETCELLKIK